MTATEDVLPAPPAYAQPTAVGRAASPSARSPGGAARRAARLAGRRLPRLAGPVLPVLVLAGRLVHRATSRHEPRSTTTSRSSPSRSTGPSRVRTVVMAAIVTLTTIVLAFPIAFYMAKVASTRDPRAAGRLDPAAAVVRATSSRSTPGGSSSSESGVLNGVLAPFGLHGPGYGDVAVWLVETYLWLPYMIIPIYAGLERVPGSLLEASSDLGGAHRSPRSGGSCFRWCCRPSSPGSIFTFSLTLGDYITPTLVSNTQVHGQRRSTTSWASRATSRSRPPTRWSRS